MRLFPDEEYKVCSELLCNYGSDIAQLTSRRKNHLCVHGEFWAAQHVRYIQQMCKVVYPGSRKFHVSDLFGGHSEFLNQHVTRLNDEPVLSLLADITTDQPDTAVDVVSDH
jgi:hypothetical protein